MYNVLMHKSLWILVFFSVLIWSSVNPKDYFTWFLEVLPAVLALIALGITSKKFRFTNLSYSLILIHSVILMIGGHYTYAEVPLPEIVNNIFGAGRNNYDKIGHLAQGFIPAVVIKEFFIRKDLVKSRSWINFFVISTCLAISAFYELIEWWVALAVDETAEAFLGTQGYIWDTQSDMGYALAGAILALVTLTGILNKQIGNRVD